MSAALTTASPLSSPLCHDDSNWTTAHNELAENQTLWRALAFEGLQSDGQGGLFENRRCPCCASTLTRPISSVQAIALCQRQTDIQARSLEALSEAYHVPA
jgi:hypothetical protein